MKYKRITICKTKIDNISIKECLIKVDQLVSEREPSCVVTPNVDHIVRLHNDEEFRNIYRDASLVLADGMPLMWAGKFLGAPIKEKVSGSDLLPRICEEAPRRGWKLFFIGGRPGAADKAKEIMEQKYPSIQIVGTLCPDFGFEKDLEQNKQIIKVIKKAKPDILFVGLGSPKQEKWINDNKDLYQAPVSAGIGVTFEFIAGMVKRAPVWMQKSGLEWFWRLIQEPSRLWKRYLIDDPIFFWLVFKQKMGWFKD